MEIKIKQQSRVFLKNLGLLNKELAGSNNIAAYDNYCFKVKADGGVTVLAADGEIQSEMSLAEHANGEGSFMIGKRALSGYLQSLGDSEVELDVKDNTCTIKRGRDFFECMVLDGMEFPIIDWGEKEALTITLPCDKVAAGINSVLWAAGTEYSRPVLIGVCMNATNGRIEMASTDGTVLSRWSAAVDAVCDIPQIIIPTKAAKRMLAVAQANPGKDMVLDIGSKMRFSVDGFSSVTTLVSGKYPNYNAVFPQDAAPTMLIFDGGEMRDAINRAGLASDSSGKVVLDACMGQVIVKSEDLGLSTRGESVINCRQEGANCTIAVNGSRLIDGLNVVSGEVEMGIHAANRPIVFRSLRHEDNLDVIIMPMML